MEVRQVVNSVFKSCSYVIVNDGASWLVDCGDVDRILPLIDGTLQGVLLTHGHFDHIYGLNVLAAIFPSLPIYTCQAGLEELQSDKLNLSKYYEEPFVLSVPEQVRLVENGEKVDLFDGIQAQAVFTPGHCPSCVTWIVDELLFTGDSFIPDVKTVTNLPRSEKALAATSEELIKELTKGRAICAGHSPEQES